MEYFLLSYITSYFTKYVCSNFCYNTWNCPRFPMKIVPFKFFSVCETLFSAQKMYTYIKRYLTSYIYLSKLSWTFVTSYPNIRKDRNNCYFEDINEKSIKTDLHGFEEKQNVLLFSPISTLDYKLLSPTNKPKHWKL